MPAEQSFEPHVEAIGLERELAAKCPGASAAYEAKAHWLHDELDHP